MLIQCLYKSAAHQSFQGGRVFARQFLEDDNEIVELQRRMSVLDKGVLEQIKTNRLTH